VPTPPSERAVRIAENETRFRDINHRLAEDLEPLVAAAEPIGFVCECGHPDCTAELRLPLDDYRRVRADPIHFAVLPDHEIKDVEDVVERNDGFLVVRKHEPTRPIAERTDPT
jgi:hypothetical protein